MGTIVENTEDNEFLEYTIDLKASGTYAIGVFTTSDLERKGFFSMDDQDISGIIDFLDTGSFSTNYQSKGEKCKRFLLL